MTKSKRPHEPCFCNKYQKLTMSLLTCFYMKPYSDWLRAGRSGNLIPVGARFFTHVQTGPEAHAASCTMGTRSFPGVKRPRRGADHPPPSSAEVKKEYSYTSTHTLGHLRHVTGLLTYMKSSISVY
jgi:hypothetical protein